MFFLKLRQFSHITKKLRYNESITKRLREMTESSYKVMIKLQKYNEKIKCFA